MKKALLYFTLSLSLFSSIHSFAQSFKHPGLLQTEESFTRMRNKVKAGLEPWLSGWNRLTSNSHASLNWINSAVDTVYRGNDGVHEENYKLLYNDIAAAYATAIRWKVSGDVAYANKSIEILNAWSAKLKYLGGDNDRVLAAGLYGAYL
jgi:hypothetical protein